MKDYSSYLKEEGTTIIEHYSKKETVKVYSFKIPKRKEWHSYNLPDWLLDYVNSAIYAVNDDAIKTIEYLFKQALLYDSTNQHFRGYDTCIREELSDIKFTFINKAVALLCDYNFDSNYNYFTSPQNTIISRNTLKKLILYQIYGELVGRGMQIRLAFSGNYDDYYNKVSYYQNDYWLKQLLLNEEKLHEEYIDKMKKMPYVIDEGHEAEEVLAGEHVITCHKYTITFSYYQRKIDVSEVTTVSDFESNFTNDIADRKIKVYDVYHYSEYSALKLALNTITYELFGDLHKFDINPVTDFKYYVKCIKENTGSENISIELANSK